VIKKLPTNAGELTILNCWIVDAYFSKVIEAGEKVMADVVARGVILRYLAGLSNSMV
jgi:hypothetical protein